MPSISVGTQFIHLDCFSRNRPKNTKQWTTQDIIHELIRTPDNSKHVKEPEAPIILDGMHPHELEKEIEAILKNGRDGGGRKLRKDSKIFIGSVASYPVPADQLDTQEKRDAYFQWEIDTTEFYRSFFGAQNLRVVIKHLDEGFVHVHALVMPCLDETNRFDFDSIHPSHRARRNYRAQCARDKKEPSKREIDKVVAEALVGFQDEYYEKVGSKNGLARFGSRGKPVSYGQWKKQNKKRDKAPAWIVDALRHNPRAAPEFQEMERRVETHAAVSAAFEEISVIVGVPPTTPAAVPAAIAELTRAANSVPEFAARVAEQEKALKEKDIQIERAKLEKERWRLQFLQMRSRLARIATLIADVLSKFGSPSLKRIAQFISRKSSDVVITDSDIDQVANAIKAESGGCNDRTQSVRTRSALER